MTRRQLRPRLAACLLALLSATLPAAAFQRDGTYIYKADGLRLGTERFTTEVLADGYRISSRTDLDLDAYLLRQTSLMEVGFDLALRRLQVAGNSGGKAFGFDVRALGASLYVLDTISGEATVLDFDPPYHWVVGNFMQHLTFAFASYDRAAGGRQEIPTQAGPLAVEPMGTTGLHGPTASVQVEHFRVTFLGGALDLYVDAQDRIDRIDLDGQPVSIFRGGFEDWRVGALAETAAGGGSGAGSLLEAAD